MDIRKAQHWRKQISRWRSSGMSMKAFCQQEGLVLGTMSRWNWELKRSVIGQKLVELKASTMLEGEPERPQTPIEVVIGRYVVRVPADAGTQQMRQVLEVLESRV